MAHTCVLVRASLPSLPLTPHAPLLPPLLYTAWQAFLDASCGKALFCFPGMLLSDDSLDTPQEAAQSHLLRDSLHPYLSPPAAELDIRPSKLLTWCQQQTEGYQHVNVTDLTTSWRSGLALCAIIHRFRPELM